MHTIARQKRLAAGYANGFHGNLFRDRDLSGIVPGPIRTVYTFPKEEIRQHRF